MVCNWPPSCFCTLSLVLWIPCKRIMATALTLCSSWVWMHDSFACAQNFTRPLGNHSSALIIIQILCFSRKCYLQCLVLIMKSNKLHKSQVQENQTPFNFFNPLWLFYTLHTSPYQTLALSPIYKTGSYEPLLQTGTRCGAKCDRIS